MIERKVHCPPNLEERPFEMTAERVVDLAPKTLFYAWTTGWGDWFAAPETVLSTGGPGSTFFFEVHPPGKRFPHYGRFLRSECFKMVELTWVTGPTGTKGAETVITVEFEEVEGGTLVKLKHAGFPDEESRDKHKVAWPMVLEQMEIKLKAKQESATKE